MRWLHGIAAAVVVALGCGATTPSTPIDAPIADSGTDAAPPIAVLFVGNSYTYVNDLPAEVAALADPSAPIAVTSSTVGGATLGDHWNGAARTAIEAGGHAIVVLQRQSLEPLVAPTDFAANADALATAATAAGARVVFYQTWARRAGDVFYGDPASGGTPAAMQDGLTAGYAAAATRNQATVAPAGEAFRRQLATAAAIELYDPDGSHPSAAGTYLVAAVMVETLSGRPPNDAARLGLDAPTRAALRAVAHATVAR